jgi:hypothetical protein
MRVVRTLIGPIVACAAFVLAASTGSGATPATRPAVGAVDRSSWPQSLTATVGDIAIRIDGPKLWTMSGITYQGNVMAVEDSAYGTVLTIKNVGHLGTAHFLEVPSKPGEVEKENVASLKFFVDEKPLARLQPTMKVAGESFRMERTSSIRGLNLKSSVDIRDGVLIETAHFNMVEPIDMVKAHPMMYAWTPKNALYAFGDDKGVQERGTFSTDGRKEKMVKNARWMAVFDPASGKGSVCYMLQRPPAAEDWFLVIDVPDIYRKVALYTLADRVVPAGFEGTFQSAVGFFSATQSNWEAEALNRVNALKSMAATN